MPPCSTTTLTRSRLQSLRSLTLALPGHSVRSAAPLSLTMGQILSRITGKRGQACCYATPSTVRPNLADSLPAKLRLAVIGDVHNTWRQEEDLAALHALNVDLAVLVGDFGNENLELVSEIATLEFPKAVILGNHDAWWTMKARSGIRRNVTAPQTQSAADLLAQHNMETLDAAGGGRVAQQLRALGPSHLGYNRMAVQGRQYSLVGSRPFSKGGGSEGSIRDFVSELYPGVDSFEASAQRIVQVASACPTEHALIFVGHNGPLGLGDQPQDICGKDWERKGGDHGDKDLQAALSSLWGAGRRVALVLFGHMHHVLHKSQRNKLRRMVAVDPLHGTVYLNAATVPRIIGARGPGAQLGATHHHFLVVDLEDGEAVAASDTWVEVAKAPIVSGGASSSPPAASGSSLGSDEERRGSGAAAGSSSGGVSNAVDVSNSGNAAATVNVTAAAAVASRFSARVVREKQVLRTVKGDNGTVKFVWNAFDDRWEPVVMGQQQPADAAAAGAGAGGASDNCVSADASGSAAAAAAGTGTAGQSLGGSVDASMSLDGGDEADMLAAGVASGDEASRQAAAAAGDGVSGKGQEVGAGL